MYGFIEDDVIDNLRNTARLTVGHVSVVLSSKPAFIHIYLA